MVQFMYNYGLLGKWKLKLNLHNMLPTTLIFIITSADDMLLLEDKGEEQENKINKRHQSLQKSSSEIM